MWSIFKIKKRYVKCCRCCQILKLDLPMLMVPAVTLSELRDSYAITNHISSAWTFLKQFIDEAAPEQGLFTLNICCLRLQRGKSRRKNPPTHERWVLLEWLSVMAAVTGDNRSTFSLPTGLTSMTLQQTSMSPAFFKTSLIYYPKVPPFLGWVAAFLPLQHADSNCVITQTLIM